MTGRLKRILQRKSTGGLRLTLSMVLLGMAAPSLGQVGAMQQFCAAQLLVAVNGEARAPEVNARVMSIWHELVNYSKHAFPIFPAQQCTAGQATPSGIYLDISIAADPNVEVTRFFLAHEWGHMMHGDPLTGLTPLGRYQMLTGGTDVEDKADTYAATLCFVFD